MVEVVVTDEFAAWYEGLSAAHQEDVRAVVTALEIAGVQLGGALSKALTVSKFALRELRIQSKGQPFRVLYAFDPARQAVLLVAGNKKGWDRFYEEMIPLAEKVWKEYLRETGQK